VGGTLIGAVKYKGFVPWDDDIDIAMLRDDYEKFLNCCSGELSARYFVQNYRTDVDFYPPLTRLCILGTYVREYYSEHLRFNKGLYFDIHPLDNIPDDAGLQRKQERNLQLIDLLMFFKLNMVYQNGRFRWKKIGKKALQILLGPVPLRFLQQKREKVMQEYAGQDTANVCMTGIKYGYRKGIYPRSIFEEPVLLEFEDGKYYAPKDWHAFLRVTYGDGYLNDIPLDEQKPLHEVFEI
jgi:lipopolysaccharide cholinephosphotransferase